MRVLTVTQPWATLLASGAKRIETRGWRTPYRGLVAIHAAKGFPRWARELWERPVFAAALREAGALDAGDLPRGVIVGAGLLTGIASTDTSTCRWWLRWLREHDRPHERTFGDFTPGRFGWWLDDMVQLPEPVAHRGAQGLRALPDDVARAVFATAVSAPLAPLRARARLRDVGDAV